MSQAREFMEESLLQRLRRLPLERRRELLDFLEFLESREQAQGWLEFDEWAVNLAKEKGFAHLTEEDVSRIVSDFRAGK